MQAVRRAVLLLIVLAMAGCGSSHKPGVAIEPTTPTSLVAGGDTYTQVSFNDIRAAGPSSLYLDGLLYLAPRPIKDYPRQSVIVEGPLPGRTPYIWTGSQLVLLAPPCAVQPPGMAGGC